MWYLLDSYGQSITEQSGHHPAHKYSGQTCNFCPLIWEEFINTVKTVSFVLSIVIQPLILILPCCHVMWW